MMWPRDVELKVGRYLNKPMIRVLEELCQSDDIGIAGNASCVAGNTRLLDAKTGKSHPIKELCEQKKRIWVQTLNGPVLSEIPFLKGAAQLFEVKLSNGAKFTCTAQHRLLSKNGWMNVSSLRNSDAVFAYSPTLASSTLEPCLSVSHEDARHCSQIAGDSQSSYFAYFHLCGEQLRAAQAACLNDAPLQVDAQTRSLYGVGSEGGFLHESSRIQTHESPFLSNPDAALRSFVSGNLSLFRFFSKTLSQFPISFRQLWIFWLKNALRRTFSKSCCHERGKQNMATESFPSVALGYPFDSKCIQSFLPSFQSYPQQVECSQVRETSEQFHHCDFYSSHLSASSDLRVTLARIESITSVGVGDFYDLHVPGEEHYFAEGGIHHNSSKTFSVAAWLVFDWYSCPAATLSFVASTSLSGSEDRIWGTVARLHKCASFPCGHLIDHRKMIVFENPDQDDQRDYSNAIKAIAFPQGEEGKKAVDTTRGRKNKRVRVVVDELAEMEGYVNNVRVNLSSNDDFVYVGIANPAPGENPHKDLCEPDHPKGWDSVNSSVRKWKTRTGTAIFLSGLDSPNFEAPEDEPPPFPYLLTRKKEQKMLELVHGNKNALEYKRNCEGYWPTDSTDLSVISRSMIKESDISREPTWSSSGKVRLAALDCGWTSGGDRNCVTFGFVAALRGATKRAAMFTGTKTYHVDVGADFNSSLASKVVPDLLSFGVSPEHFGIDVSGDGGKVYAAFVREWIKIDPSAHQIVPLTSSGSATDRVVSLTDKRKGSDVYDRRVTEYWFSLYHGIYNQCIYGLDLDEHRDLVNELVSRRYTFKNKKLSVETKRDMKSRLGKSPDAADSLTYFWEMARRSGVDLIANNNAEYVSPVSTSFSRIEIGAYSGGCSDPDGF